MAIDRTTIIRGPAFVTFRGATFFSKNDIEIPISKETMNIETSAYGKVDEHVKERKCEINLELVGQWDANTIAAIWTPYRTMVAGTSIFTASDTPIVITSLIDGTTVTGAAAAITKLPDIICSAVKTLIGPMTIEVIGANNTDWSTASSLLTVVGGSGPPSDPGTFSSALILTKTFTAGYGTVAGFTSFQTQDGITVSFGLQTAPQEVDTSGLVDMYFKQLDVTAKCNPLGMTESQLIAALQIQGGSSARGESLVGANNLVITGAGSHPIITLNLPSIKSARMKWGQTVPRMGEVEFVATKSGPSDNLFTITL